MNICITYLIIAAILLAAELLYFRIADKCNIVDKPNERSSHTKVVIRGGGIIFVIGLWVWSAFFGFQYPWMLAAENEGLATLWVGSFDPALLRDILPDAEGYELVAMINVGYPVPDSKPSAMHGVRKSVGELVTKVE